MSSFLDSQNIESYPPLYDTVPEKWEEARAFFVETLKLISNNISVREIGFYLDIELLSGKQFIPSQQVNNSDEFRSIFRKVVNTGPLVPGVNPGVNHGILFDERFTLIQLWVSGTNSTTFIANSISGNITMNATQLVVISPMAYDRSYAVIEYLLEP